MAHSKKIGPTFVAAVALVGVACAVGCSGSREASDDQASSALVVSPDLVISQIYGGGGNTGATYTHDFIELFNRGSSAVSLGGKSVQYASSTGNFSSSSNVIELPNVSLDPGKYFLIQLAGGATGSALPAADLSPASPTNLGSATGKVALVDSAAKLNACGATNNPCTPGGWIDLVGYGTSASQSEGSNTLSISNTTAAIRKNGGCDDTGTNSVDFAVATPTPRSGASGGTNVCSGTPVDAGTTDSAAPGDSGSPASLVLLNEVRINPAGSTDSPYEYAELRCTPNASLDGYYFAALEGDGDSAAGNPGVADIVVSLAGKTCGANGIVYIKAAAGGTSAQAAQSTVVTSAALDTGSSPIENATTSLVVIHSPTTAITATTDYDTNNDGTIDLPAGGSIVDGVSVFDQSDGAVDHTYAPRLIVGNSPPDGLVRRPNDTAAMSASAWYFGELTGTTGDSIDFDLAKPLSAGFPSDGQMTPGAANVGTGAPITDGGTTPTDGGTTTSEGGAKVDGGVKTDGGGEEEPPPEEEEEEGADGGTTGGTRKDAGKAATNGGSSSTTPTPPSSGGCAAAPAGQHSDAGFVASALAALGSIVALRRLRRRR